MKAINTILDKTSFNRQFKLSVDGKFCGLDKIENPALLLHKLSDRLNSRRRARVHGDTLKIQFRCCGHNVTCYAY